MRQRALRVRKEGQFANVHGFELDSKQPVKRPRNSDLEHLSVLKPELFVSTGYRALARFIHGGLKSEVQHLTAGKVPGCKAGLRTNNFSPKSA